MLKVMRLPAQLLHRKADSHKGDFGHVLIIAGSVGLSGAAALCSESAMRSGCGLVTLGVPKGINNALIKIKIKEVMTLPLPQNRQGDLSLSAYSATRKFFEKTDVLVIGPGLGQNKETQKFIRKVLSGFKGRTVIDADGLNALINHLDLLKNNDILTPHPKEMARLLGVTVKFIQDNRVEISMRFADKYGVTLVLKGKNTVVVDYQGNLYINKTGNPGMATAGSGDVLSGMIAAFLGQGLDNFSACKYAVYLHGLAGDLAAKEKTQISMIASDIINKIPQAIKKSS
ncbi:NAD(P)H-hydrate dehydratase [bacterium]|nr:MAG: NAD(P)H-hydrate dehydratase [bacterium]